MVNAIQFNATRFAEDGQSLLYAKIGNGAWSFFHMDTDAHRNPVRVGAIYKTKAELLADLYRYAKEWGFTV